MQHGLRLIVRRVRDSDNIARATNRGCSQEVVPRIASGLFNSSSSLFGKCTNRRNLDVARNIAPPTQRFHPTGVGIGVGTAQLVIQMCGSQS